MVNLTLKQEQETFIQEKLNSGQIILMKSLPKHCYYYNKKIKTINNGLKKLKIN